MKLRLLIVNLFIYLESVICRDFYMGMFRRDDFLVAQDNVYKERRPYSFINAEYGRLFECKVTYFRVVDRLGIGRGPTVKIVRGGLQQKYIAVRIKSGYNLPISVNIYVGCENPKPRGRPTFITTKATSPEPESKAEGEPEAAPEGEGGEDKKDENPEPEGDSKGEPEGGAEEEEGEPEGLGGGLGAGEQGPEDNPGE